MWDFLRTDRFLFQQRLNRWKPAWQQSRPSDVLPSPTMLPALSASWPARTRTGATARPSASRVVPRHDVLFGMCAFGSGKWGTARLFGVGVVLSGFLLCKEAAFSGYLLHSGHRWF